MKKTFRFSKALNILFFTVIGAAGLIQVAWWLSNPKQPDEPRLGRLQRVVGILPDTLSFHKCKIELPASVYLQGAQYWKGRVSWKYGIVPSIDFSGDPIDPFYLFSTGTNQRISIGRLDSEKGAAISSGTKNCEAHGSCVKVPNALRSGHTGVTLRETHPKMLFVPDLGLMISMYGEQPPWLQCVNAS